MKRIYRKKEKKQVREKALEQFRETRKKLEGEHPELLGSLRDKILESEQSLNMSNEDSESIAIDRKKNMDIVLRFLEMNPGFLEGDLKGLLSGKYH
ncbi:MAG: hypothetical protein DHS20C02_02680 [Micavibrio sp.]|nr:MAG: hypothetical protein DHS20C02_02680 [Micavibrio sp.]